VFFRKFILFRTPISQKMKKNFKKFMLSNQLFTRKMKKNFKKNLEVKKKYLPLHSQTETKGLQIGDETEKEKVL
jgi:hypothetical protein